LARYLAVEIVEAEIRSAQHEVLLDAARLMLSGEPVEIAQQLRDRAEDSATANGSTSPVSWATVLTLVGAVTLNVL
jgi:hypothetical protein